jgi:hypothetical protein
MYARQPEPRRKLAVRAGAQFQQDDFGGIIDQNNAHCHQSNAVSAAEITTQSQCGAMFSEFS